MSNWFVVDSRSETLSRPAGMGSITAGASGIVKTALSVNGTAVYVTTPNYDVLPTPDQPAGKSRRGVYNLFAWVLR